MQQSPPKKPPVGEAVDESPDIQLATLTETNSNFAPENRHEMPQKETRPSYSNHPFSVA